MLYLLIGIVFKGVQVLLVKLAVSEHYFVYVSAGAAVSWIVFIFGFAASQLPEHPFDLTWPRGYLMVLGIGVISAIADLAAYRALTHLPASFVSAGMAAYPVITAIAAYLLLHERLRGIQYVGGGLIILGFFLLIYFNEGI